MSLQWRPKDWVCNPAWDACCIRSYEEGADAILEALLSVFAEDEKKHKNELAQLQYEIDTLRICK